jgi:hypothetical protein
MEKLGTVRNRKVSTKKIALDRVLGWAQENCKMFLKDLESTNKKWQKLDYSVKI